MKTIFLLSAAVLLFFSLVSCGDSKPDSEVSKNFSIDDFSSLNLELIGEVFYEQSDSSYMNVSGSSTLIEALKMSNKKGQLSIELKNKRKYSGSKKTLEIRLGSPQLYAINSKSIGNFHLKNYFEGSNLEITNTGIGQIMIDDCNVDTFNLTSKSIGLVKVTGISNAAFINSEGLGEIDCSEFKARNVTVVSKGVSDLSVYAQESINVSISGLGNVTYYGNPSEVKTNISGMGKVTKKEP